MQGEYRYSGTIQSKEQPVLSAGLKKKEIQQAHATRKREQCNERNIGQLVSAETNGKKSKGRPSSPDHRLLNPSRRAGPVHIPPRFSSSASASLSNGTARPRYSISSIQAAFNNNSSSDSDSRPGRTGASLVAGPPLVPVLFVASFESGPTTVPERVRRMLESNETAWPGALLGDGAPGTGLTKSDARIVPARFRAGIRLTDFFVADSARATAFCKELARGRRGLGAGGWRVSLSECVSRSPAPNRVNQIFGGAATMEMCALTMWDQETI